MYRRLFCLKPNFYNTLAVFSRKFTKGKILCSKKFEERENDYAYSIIKQLNANRECQWHPLQTPSINVSNLDDSSAEAANLCQKFRTLSEEAKGTQRSIEDPTLESFINGLVSVLPRMADGGVVDVLRDLGDWPTTYTTRSPHFTALWNGLDAECVKRCPKWQAGHLFFVAGLWFKLKLSRISKYNSTMIRMFIDGGLGDELDIHSLVRLLFYVNLQRAVSSGFMIQVEERLRRDIEQLSLDEVAVVALAYFKTKTRMHSMDFVCQIVLKTLNGLKDAKEITLVAIFKSLRFSSRIELQNVFEDLQKSCVPHLERFNPTLVMHTALLCAADCMCSDDLLTQMMKKFTRDIDSIRLKDLSRSMFCLAMFAPDRCADYAATIVENFRSSHRMEEMELYKFASVSLVLYLAYVGCYPPSLIDKCLTKDFLKIAKEGKVGSIEREAYVLDCSVGIEFPEYSGSRLPDELKRSIFTEKQRENKVTSSYITKFISEVKERFDVIFGGDQFCHACQILPHFQHSDILITMTSNSCLKPVPIWVKNMSPGAVIVPPVNEKWMAVVIGGRLFYNKRTRKPLGPSIMKMRHLRKLGYTVLEIPWFKYEILHGPQREKELRAKIFEICQIQQSNSF